MNVCVYYPASSDDMLLVIIGCVINAYCDL